MNNSEYYMFPSFGRSSQSFLLKSVKFKSAINAAPGFAGKVLCALSGSLWTVSRALKQSMDWHLR